MITQTSTLDAACEYIRSGRAVVPVPARSKRPVHKAWQTLRITEDQAPSYFSSCGNIGIALGAPSGGLVDVDLDCAEARELAPRFLPATPVITGHPGNPAAHWWYVAPGASTAQYRDPVNGEMMVELRSTGAQTLVGPSVHPESGGAYDVLRGDPPTVEAAKLAQCVQALADAAARARHPGYAGRAAAKPRAAKPTMLPSSPEVLSRATAYLDAMPPAISGAGGHAATYAAATAMVHGFGLEPEVAFDLLVSRYNPRCEPMWTEKELRHKVDDAKSKPHERPYGWLRDQEPEHVAPVDLTGLTRRTPEITVVASEFPPEPEHDRPANPGGFPSELLHVPGFVGQVVEYNLRTAVKPQPVLALSGAIGLQAVLSGRKVRDERGNRTNLYSIVIAPSGAGKDHARKLNRSILYAAGLDTLEGCEELASDAGLLTAVAESPAVLLQIDEFGRFLRTIGDPRHAPHLYNVVSTFMKLYSSADTVFKGKGYADAAQNKVVDQPCVSLYATTVPENLWAGLTPESLGDGFVGRLLVFEAPSWSGRRKRPRTEDVPAAIVTTARWWGEFSPGGNLHREHPQPVVVRATPEAEAVFDGLADTVDLAASSGEFGSALWARAEEKACRLALVYACSENPESPCITESAARWACGLAEYTTRLLLFKASQWVADGAFDARQKRVLRAISDAGGRITKSALCRKTQYLTVRERDEVIANLLATRSLLVKEIRTATKPETVYELTSGAGAAG